MFWQSASPCIFVLTTAKQKNCVLDVQTTVWFSWGCEITGTTVQRRGHIWPASHPYFLLPSTCRLRWVTHLTYCTCSSLPPSPTHLQTYLRSHLTYHLSIPPSPTLLQSQVRKVSDLLIIPSYFSHHLQIQVRGVSDLLIIPSYFSLTSRLKCRGTSWNPIWNPDPNRE